jgi:hypothetical protein
MKLADNRQPILILEVEHPNFLQVAAAKLV